MGRLLDDDTRPTPSIANKEAAEMPPAHPLEAYTVGWICAIPCELAAAIAMLDDQHAQPKTQAEHDKNNYTLGSIAEHNIAIVCSEPGPIKAAVAANAMQMTFPNIRFALLVGVGSGVPDAIESIGTEAANDIRLGDVVVSMPTGQGPGVIQYDCGRMEEDGFLRAGALDRPPALLRTAVASLRAESDLRRQLTSLIEDASARFYRDDEDSGDQKSELEPWVYPGADRDVLFHPKYEHRSSEGNRCAECIEGKAAGEVITRPARMTRHPKVHYGNIGSGNWLMRNGVERDRIAKRDNIICLETEAAGVMDALPCLVIRGISDYADSHRNDDWQSYAAMVAAAYAMQLLCIVPPQGGCICGLAPVQGSVESEPPRSETDNGQSTNVAV